MRKKHSIVKFVIISLICAVFLCLTIFSFALPGAQFDYDFMGFARAINLGIEYQGGTVYHFKVNNDSNETNIFNGGLSYSTGRIKTLLKNNSYDANVYDNGSEIVVELKGEYNPISINEIVNTKPKFAIKSTSGDDAEVAINASMVTNAYATNEQGGVLFIFFTTEGQEKLASLTSSGSGTLYFDFGDAEIPMSYSSEINQNYLGMTVGDVDKANYYANEAMSSKYSASYTQTSVETFDQQDAQKNVVVAILLTVVLFTVCVAILCIRFKKLGLVGSLVLLISVLAQIVLLQAVPIFVLTGPSLFASLICMIVGTISIYLMLNNMSKEYKLGKILTASVKFGYDKIWKLILTMFIVMLFPSIITYFFGAYLVKHFAMALICGLGVYALCTLLFTRFFTRWLTNITFKNKDYGFTREAHVNELK
ncbi:MAG: hypothetical protein ACI4TZ_00645 [Christensenellales bacterium]